MEKTEVVVLDKETKKTSLTKEDHANRAFILGIVGLFLPLVGIANVSGLSLIPIIGLWLSAAIQLGIYIASVVLCAKGIGHAKKSKEIKDSKCYVFRVIGLALSILGLVVNILGLIGAALILVYVTLAYVAAFVATMFGLAVAGLWIVVIIIGALGGGFSAIIGGLGTSLGLLIL